MSFALLGFDLQRPEWVLLLLAAPVAVVVALWSRRRATQARKLLAAERMLPELFAESDQRRARRRVLLGCLALFWLGLALLGPVRGYVLRDVPRRGLDLVLCLDTSRSMLVEDMGRSRLDEAKRQIHALLDELKGDRIALLAFSGDVRAVAPLTRDRKTLGWFLDALGPEDNRRGGTDLGGAVEEALGNFDQRSGAHEAIILVTDGEDLEGRALELADAARANDIRIYVLGMGTESGGKIPATGGGWMVDPEGEEVISKLDSSTLANVADATGGMYLPAEGSVLALTQLYGRGIGQLEGRTYQDGKERVPYDRYQWPLVLGVLFMALEMATTERRRRAKVKQSS
ncbi:MAG: Ca-activated chloride channel family protein [Planctomycetota bacterium]|jgi:Ca-activated chloride channel family protein